LVVFRHELYSAIPLPEGHPYPIRKHEALCLSLEGLPVEWREAVPANRGLLEAVHDPAYLDAFERGVLPAAAMRRVGFPWSPLLVRRTLNSVGGTVEAAKVALERGLAFQTAGGYHHAHRDYGAGYCMINDIVVAARALIDEGLCRLILVVDLDAHQGDGTAALTAGSEDILTLSLHGDRIFPARKTLSRFDFPLPAGTGDLDYLSTLDRALDQALGTGRPDLIIYQAGVDIHEDDLLGKFTLSEKGIRRRDRKILDLSAVEAIPLLVLPGGGYQRDWRALVPLHRIVFEEAAARNLSPALLSRRGSFEAPRSSRNPCS
jgi:acetoin utilization deacetylase AcuC-like enzyme